MANFCSNCAGPLEADARFCPACSAPVSVSAALAGELRAGVQAGVRSLVQAPTMKVPAPVWAGVIQVFWVMLACGALTFYVLGALGTGASGMLFGSSGRAERMVIWFGFNALYYVALLSVQIPLALGFFGFKRWAYGLYMWTIAPTIVLGLILSVSAPTERGAESSSPVSFTMLAILGWILVLGLVGLQIYLVWRSKDRLVN